MSTIVVLAMHGAPPNDFPPGEMAEFFMLHGRLPHAAGPEKERMQQRMEQIETRLRTWKRTAANDPFYTSSVDMGERLSKKLGMEVLVGFNEFCAPSLEDALAAAVEKGPAKIIVVTPMMTRGGEHAEKDIPGVIRQFQAKHPSLPVVYAWPFDAADVTDLLARQIRKHV